MKTINTIILVAAIALTSCTRYKQIGKVNMISNRNIDNSLKYQVLTTYSGGNKHEIKKSRAVTIEDAIDQTVKKVPGGEYLMNAKIYLVNTKYLAVEGDVWGNSAQISHRGFKVGDKVTWKNKKNIVEKIKGEKDYFTGTINALKNDKACLVKEDETSDIIELEYEKITKQ